MFQNNHNKMNDQANTLRLIASASPPLNLSETATMIENDTSLKKENKFRCLAITGGKGGVGKSNLTVNLSLELGALGKKVILLDADFGLANADILCGVSPEFHLGHVIGGIKDLKEVVIELAETVMLVPGGSGVEELANFSLTLHSHIFKRLQTLEQNLDYMLIDTAAGIARNVLGILMAAAEVVVVVTPEPTSVVDAYATIKTIFRHAPEKPVSIVVNNVTAVGDSEKVFQQLNYAALKFLNRKVEFLGMIPHDQRLSEAVREQIPLVRFAPDAPASRAVRLIARQLQNQVKQGLPFPIQSESFWNMLADSN